MSNIHQEVTLPAAHTLVYQALVDTKKFAELTGAPASGDGSDGAAFSAFGGHITGRNVELLPGKRVVQAWRAKTWPDGMYSIVRFELKAEGKGTRIVFDHDGFPEDMHKPLSEGWQSNYWDNLKKLG